METHINGDGDEIFLTFCQTVMEVRTEVNIEVRTEIEVRMEIMFKLKNQLFSGLYKNCANLNAMILSQNNI